MMGRFASFRLRIFINYGSKNETMDDLIQFIYIVEADIMDFFPCDEIDSGLEIICG